MKLSFKIDFENYLKECAQRGNSSASSNHSTFCSSESSSLDLNQDDLNFKYFEFLNDILLYLSMLDERKEEYLSKISNLATHISQ